VGGRDRERYKRMKGGREREEQRWGMRRVREREEQRWGMRRVGQIIRIDIDLLTTTRKYDGEVEEGTCYARNI
jgi:hypothetical protein